MASKEEKDDGGFEWDLDMDEDADFVWPLDLIKI